MGMLCHLAALSKYVGIPFGNIIGPLIIWLIKREEMPFVNEEGKESLNFQISMTIYMIVSALFCLIGLPLIFVLIIVDIIYVVLAAVKASSGQSYKYPLTIRFIQ